jgi:NADPH-dependent 2,4-dienoyl-CoA reductase/sulfur reductase-like enzyme/ferredoxin
MSGVNPFPSYMQLPTRVPKAAWHVSRVVSVLGALGLSTLLIADPKAGLKVWWGVMVPLLPLLWFVAPGLWRNICPLAATNQAPRLLNFTRGLTAPAWFRDYAPVAGIVLFLAAVSSRPLLFNTSGPWTAALILAALAAALLGGVLLKGKSGWCSSICPLLPVQRVYGQTPFITVPNSHCQPCVACTKNCYDFNPRVAYLADLADDDRHFTGYRLFFVGAFPGLVIAYFTLPAGLSTAEVYGRFALAVGASAGSFFLLQSIVRVSSNKLTSLYGAIALNLFYWWASPVLADALLSDRNHPAGWALRAVVLALSVAWLARTWRKEAVFVESLAEPMQTDDTTTRLGGEALAAIRNAQTGTTEVTIEPAGVRVRLKLGQSLLEVAEASDQQIEAGCRMGVCGADPICVTEGMENLSPPTADEEATLARLGLAPSTRMACCAKVRGPLTVRLVPERKESVAVKSVEGFAFDAKVSRVVIIGNGIAGLTTAEHLRRRHPECSIDIVASEPHPLYNRMGITRLIYGRSAMTGLYLLPDAWDEENDVTTWLNTQVVAIDRGGRVVSLGTGETLQYDRLVLATGSGAFVPPIEGYGLPGTYTLRTADDALSIRSFVQDHSARAAVVAGGGPLGLEAAVALSKFGLDVTVLERGESLMRRRLDLPAAQLLQSYLEGLGLTILLGAETSRVDGAQRLEHVVLTDGRSIPADLFLIATGITPAIELAHDAGLEVDRGVVVDDALRTSDPTIFAVGDVAEHRDRVLGLWPASVDQARVAAENIAGGERAYEGTIPVTILKVMGIDLLSCGRFEAEHDDEELIVHEDGQRDAYIKLLITDRRLAGAILLGHPRAGSPVSDAVLSGRDVGDVIDRLRAGDLDCLAPAEAVA